MVTTWYWVSAITNVSGKPIILGPFDTEEEANMVGFNKVGGTFRVVPLSTKDPGRATRILKYMRLNQTANLEEALKRVDHKGSGA